MNGRIGLLRIFERRGRPKGGGVGEESARSMGLFVRIMEIGDVYELLRYCIS